MNGLTFREFNSPEPMDNEPELPGIFVRQLCFNLSSEVSPSKSQNCSRSNVSNENDNSKHNYSRANSLKPIGVEGMADDQKLTLTTSAGLTSADSFRGRKPMGIGILDVSGGRSNGITVPQAFVCAEGSDLSTAHETDGNDKYLDVSQSSFGEKFKVQADGCLEIGNLRILPQGLCLANDNLELKRKQRPLSTDLLRTKWFGKGSSATVYEAIHVPTYSLVAEKVLATFDPSLQQLVVSELAALLATTERPSLSNAPLLATARACQPSEFVVGIYDVAYNPQDGSVSIVEELMLGGSLQDVIDRHGCLPPEILRYVAFCVLSGLSHLRSLKLVHGDIKPENLLLSHHGDVKISDFGISQKLSDVKINSVRATGKASQFMGSFKYMSPERLEHEPYGYGADIWSLGLVLYSCALGRYPIESNDKFEIISAVTTRLGKTSTQDHPKSDELMDPLEKHGDFGEDFKDFVRKCLERNPNKRPKVEELLSHPFVSSTRPTEVMRTLLSQNKPAKSCNKNNNVVECRLGGEKYFDAIGQVLVTDTVDRLVDSSTLCFDNIGSLLFSQRLQSSMWIAWLASHWESAWLSSARTGEASPLRQHQKLLGLHHQLGVATPLLSRVFNSVKQQATQNVRSLQDNTLLSLRHTTEFNIFNHTFAKKCSVGMLRKRATKRPFGFMSNMKWDDRVFVLCSGVLSYHRPDLSEMGDTCRIGDKLGEAVLQPSSRVQRASSIPAEYAQEFLQCGAGAFGANQTAFLERCIVLTDVLVNGRNCNEVMYFVSDSSQTASQWISAIEAQLLDLVALYARFDQY